MVRIEVEPKREREKTRKRDRKKRSRKRRGDREKARYRGKEEILKILCLCVRCMSYTFASEPKMRLRRVKKKQFTNMEERLIYLLSSLYKCVRLLFRIQVKPFHSTNSHIFCTRTHGQLSFILNSRLFLLFLPSLSLTL